MDNPPDEPVIPEADARAMIRLLADVAATPGTHEEKKRVLMEGLCELVNGDFWIWGLAADYDPEVGPVYTAMTTGGFSEEQVPKLLIALDNDKLEDSIRPLGREIVSRQRQATRLAEQYDSLQAFLDPEIIATWQDADIGPPLVCYRPISNNCISGIGIYRHWSSPPFSKREAKIADIVMNEVAWLHEQGWPWESALQVPQLSRRRRLALNLLLEGLTRKEIASKMEVSLHTVNEYIKHIYLFFGVHSHAELLNRFRIGDIGEAA